MLSFHIVSGSGSDGQHGSDGLKGKDGVNAPNGNKMMWGGNRKNVCGWFSSVRFQIQIYFHSQLFAFLKTLTSVRTVVQRKLSAVSIYRDHLVL